MNDIANDVLICGAGAAGLALAIELARRGVSFRLIDKAPGPFAGSRGKGIQPRTLEVFEDMGIVDRFFALGSSYPLRRAYDEAGGIHDSPLAEAAEASTFVPYPSPLLMPQFLTERLMRDRLAELGHAPQFDCELLGLSQDSTGVSAMLRSGGRH